MVSTPARPDRAGALDAPPLLRDAAPGAAMGGLVRLVTDLLRRHRVLRFLVVGGINTVVGYGLFLAALWLMPTTFLALCVSYPLAILFNFMSTGRLVFESRDLRRLLPFVAVYGLLFAYNALGLRLLEAIGVAPWLAGLLLLPGAVVLGYVLNRSFVFQVGR